MSQIRFGVVGAGAIAHNACKAIAAHGEAIVVAAHDPHAGRLAELATAYGIARQHVDADAFFADDGIDAIYIGVPNKFHAPLALRALQAGKHVLLDKPFALNLAEAQEVADLAQAKGLTLMLGMNHRFRPESQRLRSLVAQGVLGEIYHAKAFWFRRSGIPKLGTWFGNKALAGGGALLDIGVHLLDLCLFLSGKWDPVAVTGATYTKFGNRGLGEGKWGKSDKDPNLVFDVDDFASALIRFADGSTVSLDVSWACHTGQPNANDVQLFGTEAGAAAYPDRLFRAPVDGETEYQVVTPVVAPQLLAHNERFHNFINSLLGREQPLVTVDQALTVQRILDAIYASCASGREVRLERAAAAAR